MFRKPNSQELLTGPVRPGRASMTPRLIIRVLFPRWGGGIRWGKQDWDEASFFFLFCF